MKLYLITGFLGAGKTTLLKNLIRQMSRFRLKVIINEFGKAGIDGTLVRELGVAVYEINNGSIFCSCRIDQFEETLERMVAEASDFIFVEASGLSDPTSVSRILHDDRFSSIEYKGCVCLVDAVNFRKVVSTARVCRKQISASDILIINKTDLVSNDELEVVERLLREQKQDAVIYKTTFGAIQSEWMDFSHGDKGSDSKSAYQLKDVSLRKLSITIKDTMTYYQLEKFLHMFVEDTYRVKGFVCLEGRKMYVDCVGANLMIREFQGHVTNYNKIVAMAGPSLQMDESLRRAAEWYLEFIESIE